VEVVRTSSQAKTSVFFTGRRNQCPVEVTALEIISAATSGTGAEIAASKINKIASSAGSTPIVPEAPLADDLAITYLDYTYIFNPLGAIISSPRSTLRPPITIPSQTPSLRAFNSTSP